VRLINSFSLIIQSVARTAANCDVLIKDIIALNNQVRPPITTVTFTTEDNNNMSYRVIEDTQRQDRSPSTASEAGSLIQCNNRYQSIMNPRHYEPCWKWDETRELRNSRVKPITYTVFEFVVANKITTREQFLKEWNEKLHQKYNIPNHTNTCQCFIQCLNQLGGKVLQIKYIVTATFKSFIPHTNFEYIGISEKWAIDGFGEIFKAYIAKTKYVKYVRDLEIWFDLPAGKTPELWEPYNDIIQTLNSIVSPTLASISPHNGNSLQGTSYFPPTSIFMLNDDKQPNSQPTTTLLSQTTESGPFQYNNRTASATLSTHLGPYQLGITNSQGVNIHIPSHPSPRATIGKRLPPTAKKAPRSSKSFRQYSGGKGSKLKSQKIRTKDKEVMTKESDNDEEEDEVLDKELAEESDQDVDDEREEEISQNSGEEDDQQSNKKRKRVQSESNNDGEEEELTLNEKLNGKQTKNINLQLKWTTKLMKIKTKTILLNTQENFQMLNLDEILEDDLACQSASSQMSSSHQTNDDRPPQQQQQQQSHELGKQTNSTTTTVAADKNKINEIFAKLLVKYLKNPTAFEKVIHDMAFSATADSMYQYYQKHVGTIEIFEINPTTLNNSIDERERRIKNAFIKQHNVSLINYRPDIKREQFQFIFAQMNKNKVCYVETHPLESPNNIIVDENIFQNIDNAFDYCILYYLIANSSQTIIQRYKLMHDTIKGKHDVSVLNKFGDIQLAYTALECIKFQVDDEWNAAAKDMLNHLENDIF
jgi:hypothetical protein